MSWLWIESIDTLGRLAWFCSLAAAILSVQQLRRQRGPFRKLLLVTIWVQVIYEVWDFYIAYLFPPSSWGGMGWPSDKVQWAYVRLSVLVYSFGSFTIGLLVDWRETRPIKKYVT